MVDIVLGEACKNLTNTITTIMKSGMTENKKLKAHEPAKDKSLFCKKNFVVRKTLWENVTNVIFLGDLFFMEEKPARKSCLPKVNRIFLSGTRSVPRNLQVLVLLDMELHHGCSAYLLRRAEVVRSPSRILSVERYRTFGGRDTMSNLLV